MTHNLKTLCSACAATLFIAGCSQPPKEQGYLEVNSNFDLEASDLYMFGDTPLATKRAGKTIDTLLLVPVGTNNISVTRDSTTYSLCQATVTKSRVVSVVIYSQAGRIKCSSQV